MAESFAIFIENIMLYPTIIFTGLILFVTLYWVVTLIGMADMDIIDIGDFGDINADLGVDLNGDVGGNAGSDVSSTGFFTSILLKFGLYGVPLIIILTLISIIGWVLSYIYSSFLHQWLSTGILYYVFGTGAFLLVLVVSMWLTGLILTPIRKNIAQIPKRNAANNIGKIATVRTLTVTDKHGEAELYDGGAGLILKIRQFDNELDNEAAAVTNTDNNHALIKNPPLKQGDKVVLVEYLADVNAYRVTPTQD